MESNKIEVPWAWALAQNQPKPAAIAASFNIFLELGLLSTNFSGF